VQGDEQRAHPLKMRAQTVIQKSSALIRQSSRLQEQTAGLLNQCEEKTWLENFAPVQVQRDIQWSDRRSVLRWAMGAALRIMKAPMGNLQLVDPASGTLHIAEHCGFSRQFLEYFNAVHKGEAACGLSLKTHSRTVVEDVTESDVFHGTAALEVLLDDRVRAVQSTPLIGASGAVLGILSTHWSSPIRLGSHNFRQIDFLARTVVNCLESREYAIPRDLLSSRHLSP